MGGVVGRFCGGPKDGLEMVLGDAPLKLRFPVERQCGSSPWEGGVGAVGVSGIGWRHEYERQGMRGGVASYEYLGMCPTFGTV